MIITLFAGAASAAASNALALTSKDEDVMGPLTNMLIMPILLLSGIILPMSLAPAWLERLSDFMPTRYIVDAVRAIFAENPDAATVTWESAVACHFLCRYLVGGLVHSVKKIHSNSLDCIIDRE